LVALKYRYPTDLPFCTLGAIEGNVDKLVRQRMRGRGMSWSRQGAIEMLAILRHKEDLQNHAFPYAQTSKPNKYHHRVSRAQDDYQPYQASIPGSLAPSLRILRYNGSNTNSSRISHSPLSKIWTYEIVTNKSRL